MANELYIHTLRQLRDGCLGENMDTEAEALEAAIQALSCDIGQVYRTLKQLQSALPLVKKTSAQPEQIIYANMSDEEFERWLYEHGICNPNIHESIPCDAVPLLIDNAISELPSAQPEIIRCKDCSKWQTIDCPFFSKYITVMPNEEQYCSLAERRTDG